jgi:hypothetical protein
MTTMSGHEPPASPSHAVARQRRLRRILESYGVLTVERLREFAHADRWEVPFELTLKRATRAGRVRRLAEDLYEAGPEP